MEKKIINPWLWQDARNYVQAVEAKAVESTLYVSGQTATSETGESSNEDMRTQLLKTIANLELVVEKAGFKISNIVRLNIYTTSAAELLENFDVIQSWVQHTGMKQTTTLLEVKSLFETLKVEFEATAVK